MIVKVVYHPYYGGFGLSKRAVEWMAKRGHPSAISCLKKWRKDQKKWLWPDPQSLPRHDPVLVAAVEALGKEAGSGLVVEEIGGDKYYMTEFDGKETLYTPEMEDIPWVEVKEAS